MPNIYGFNSPKYTEVEHSGREHIFRLEEPLIFNVWVNTGDGEERRIIAIRVPKGFETNFLSIPWYMRWLFDPLGPGMRAAVIHDYLYYLPEVPREFGDLVFRIALHELREKLPWYRRLPLYYAVRCFGGLSRVTRDDLEKGCTDEEKTK